MAAAVGAPTAEAPPTPPQLINLQVKCRTGRVLDLLTTSSALVDDVAVLVQRLCGWPTDQFLLVSADGKVILQPRRALRLYIAGGRLVRTDGRAADVTAVPVDPSVTPSYWLNCRHTVYDDGLRVRRHIVGISVPPFGPVNDIRSKIRLLLGSSIDVRNSTAAVELTELPSADEADATPRVLPTDNVYDASTRVLTASPRKLLAANRVYRVYIHGMNYDVLTTDIAPLVKTGTNSSSKGSAAVPAVMSAAGAVAAASSGVGGASSPTRKTARRTSIVGAFDTLAGAATAAAALAAEEARTAAVAATALAAAGLPSPSSVGGVAAGRTVVDGFAADADSTTRRSMKRSATAGELLHRGRSPAATAGAAATATTTSGASAAGGLRSRPLGVTAAGAASGTRGRSLGVRSTIFALTAQMSGMRPDCVALPTSDSFDFWVTSPPVTVTVHYAAQDMRRMLYMPHGLPPSLYHLKRLLLSCLRTRHLRCHWCPPPARTPEALHGLTATALGMSYYRWQDEPPREARLFGLDAAAPVAIGASSGSAGAASSDAASTVDTTATSKPGFPQAKKDKPCPYGLQGTCVHLSIFDALPTFVDHEDAHVHRCSVHVAPPPPPRPFTSGSRGSSTSRGPSAGSPRAAAGAAAAAVPGAGKTAAPTTTSTAAASFWASTTVAKRPEQKPLLVSAITQVRDADTLIFTDHTLSREAAADRRETAAARFHDGSGLADVVARFGTPVPIPPIAR